MSALSTPVARCQETRAHYAHRWVRANGLAGVYVDCPGGPDEGPEPGPCFAWHRVAREHCRLDHGHAGAHVGDGSATWIGDPVVTAFRALTEAQIERLAETIANSVCTCPANQGEVTALMCVKCDAENMAPVVAELIAEAVEKARAEERERIADTIESFRQERPMNGDGANYVLDRILSALVGPEELARLKRQHQDRWNAEYLAHRARIARAES